MYVYIYICMYLLHDHIFCVSRIIIFVAFTNNYGRFCCHCINKDFMPILIEALENGGFRGPFSSR